MNGSILRISLLLAAVLAVAPCASAADVGVGGRSLVVAVNALNGSVRFVSVQRGAGITPGGAGTLLSGHLRVYYADDPSNAASLAMPSPWLRNNGTVARFTNAQAPAGPSLVRAATVRAGRVAKVVARGPGGLNIATPPGPGGVIVIYTLENANDSSVHRFCTRYSTADGSTMRHGTTARGPRLRLTGGVPIACPSCSDGIVNGAESDVDCGGGTCPACADGAACNTATDCASGVCLGGTCQAPACTDGARNGDETDVDCGGGVCDPCGLGQGCTAGGDCDTATCSGGICVLPFCANGVQDGNETDVDCGGEDCPPCASGQSCLVGDDCVGLVCFANECQDPTCTDSVQNGAETGIDCGGGCPGCADGGACLVGGDCESGVCAGNVCQAPTCTDGVQNGNETGIDCGGAPCGPCSCITRGECLIFVTSTTSGGNLGTLSGADSICKLRASLAGLVGNYQAWLCDGVTAPADRSVQATVPYRRTDGALIALDWADLTDGSLANPINRNEFGGDLSATSPFLPWTYVTSAGTCDNETYLSPGSGPCPAFMNCKSNCASDGGNNGWTSSSGLAQGSKGDINATNGNWTDGVTGLCSTPVERIYCIEQ